MLEDDSPVPVVDALEVELGADWEAESWRPVVLRRVVNSLKSLVRERG